MLQTIASYFGRLESFIPLEPLKKARGLHANIWISLTMTESCLDDGDQLSEDENSLVEHELYPVPHNASRSPLMDDGCWEIKWDHRDDCVSALMVNNFCFYNINQDELINFQTLRRVPHLTVTWAHQPVSSDHPNHHQASGFAPYPLYVQDCSISAHQSPASPARSDNGNSTKINAVHQLVHRHIEQKGRDSGHTQDLTSSSDYEARDLPTTRPDAGCASLVSCDTVHRTKYAL